jgi:hypothetical protein
MSDLNNDPNIIIGNLIPITRRIEIVTKKGVVFKNLYPYQGVENIHSIYDMSPCPKCGNTKDFKIVVSKDKRRVRTVCLCGHKGPWASSTRGCPIEAWNKQYKQQGNNKNGSSCYY